MESYPSQDQMEIDLEKKDPPEDQSIVPQTPNSFNSIIDAVASTEHECINMLTGSANELPPELSSCMLKYGNSSAVDQEDSNPQV